jgi:hypothetical protein
LFIQNTLKMDNRFKVACSVDALFLFFHDKDFKGETARGEAFGECDKYRLAPLSDMWFNILLKQPAERLSIALQKILAHQEVKPSALGRVPLAEHIPHRHSYGQAPPGFESRIRQFLSLSFSVFGDSTPINRNLKYYAGIRRTNDRRQGEIEPAKI